MPVAGHAESDAGRDCHLRLPQQELRKLQRPTVPVIAITDSAFSPLARDAEIWFEVAEANFEGFRSLAATLALAMTLTVAVAEKRGS